MTPTPGFGLAFAAGLLSFLSPCILPLIPSYLSYIGGASLAELQESSPRRSETVGRTLLFVLGFSVVFVLLGLLAGTSGFLIGGTSRIISLVAGGIVVLLGLNIIFDFWKTLNIERKFHFSSKPRGYTGSVAIGMAFGAGWTPCIGPILAGILFLAGRSGNAWTGTALLLVYSLGLGVPFLIAGAFFPQFLRALSGLKRHLETIRIVSGAFLVGIGLLIAFGRLQRFNAVVLQWGAAVHRWEAAAPEQARLVLTIAFAVLGLVPLLIWGLRSKDDRWSVPRLAFFGVFGVLALLQGIGVVSLPSLIGSWLTFQGI